MLVVTLPRSAAHDPAGFALKAATAGADILEVRGDLTPNLAAFPSPLPILASPRGNDALLATRLSAAYVDLELGENAAIPESSRVIRSFHDYEKTPTEAELDGITQQLESTRPDFVKIAVRIRTSADLLRLTERQRSLSSGQRHIVLGMGWQAHWLRLGSAIHGPLAYAYIDGSDPVAPGQLPLSAYNKQCTAQAKTFAILGGDQIEHSLSPLLHGALLKRHRSNAYYTRLPVAASDTLPSLSQLHRLGIVGLSVTSPWKIHALGLAERLDPAATELQTVNTLTLKDGVWTGHNTDVIGMARGYQLPAHSRVAIVGTGGVVPAVLAALPAGSRTTLYGRNATACRALADRWHCSAASLDTLATADCDVLIWAASGDPEVPLPSAPSTDSIAIDLRYGRQTAFMAIAAARGYLVLDGLPMLLQQALEQFRLFTGIMPSTADTAELVRLLSPSDHGQ